MPFGCLSKFRLFFVVFQILYIFGSVICCCLIVLGSIVDKIFCFMQGFCSVRLCLAGIFSAVKNNLFFIHLFVDWSAAIWGGVGALVGAQIGVYISKHISGKLTIHLLSILLLVIGVKMFF